MKKLKKNKLNLEDPESLIQERPTDKKGEKRRVARGQQLTMKVLQELTGHRDTIA